MSASSWRDGVIELLRREAVPAHKFGHQPRLYALTREIAAAAPELRYDDDVVFAAAYLHDIGVFVGNRPEDPTALKQWDHVAYACERVPAILTDLSFPIEKIPAVLAAIREHQPHNWPTSSEATLLRDADILEQLGAVGILRTAAKLGSDTRFHLFGDAKASFQRALEALPGKLQLPAAQQLARSRIAVLQAFLDALAAEAGPALN